MTTVMQEIEHIVTSEDEYYISKAETTKEGLLSISIQNNAKNIMLQMDSLTICNIQLTATEDIANYSSQVHIGTLTLINSPIQLQYGASVSTTEVKLPVQELTPWNTSELPAINKNNYIRIHGTIYSHINSKELYPLYSGTMYWPVTGTITANSNSEDTASNKIPITIQPYCQLYAIINGAPEKVLQPILFTATVEDWE